MLSISVPSAKNDTGDFDRFTEFARRLLSVPHAEIKIKLDAEWEATRTIKASTSRLFGTSATER